MGFKTNKCCCDEVIIPEPIKYVTIKAYDPVYFQLLWGHSKDLNDLVPWTATDADEQEICADDDAGEIITLGSIMPLASNPQLNGKLVSWDFAGNRTRVSVSNPFTLTGTFNGFSSKNGKTWIGGTSFLHCFDSVLQQTHKLALAAGDIVGSGRAFADGYFAIRDSTTVVAEHYDTTGLTAQLLKSGLTHTNATYNVNGGIQPNFLVGGGNGILAGNDVFGGANNDRARIWLIDRASATEAGTGFLDAQYTNCDFVGYASNQEFISPDGTKAGINVKVGGDGLATSIALLDIAGISIDWHVVAAETVVAISDELLFTSVGATGPILARDIADGTLVWTSGHTWNTGQRARIGSSGLLVFTENNSATGVKVLSYDDGSLITTLDDYVAPGEGPTGQSQDCMEYNGIIYVVSAKRLYRNSLEV